jgi:hypothetical protein
MQSWRPELRKSGTRHAARGYLRMGDRATTQLFGWALGVLLIMLILNVVSG